MSKEEKFANDIFIEKAIQLHKLYCELYNDDLVGISSTNVHIDEERYDKLFSQEESKLEIASNYIQHSVILNGIKFITMKKITLNMIRNKI